MDCGWPKSGKGVDEKTLGNRNRNAIASHRVPLLIVDDAASSLHILNINALTKVFIQQSQ